MSRIPAKIGKYQIVEKIAEGGMGAVFKGTHPTLDKPVVLKKLTLSTNEHLIERFRREAKIMMEFSNENIVRVYDHFKNASAYYIVQELVDGKSVDILLKKERYLRYDEALYIFYYACKALDYAHRNQVVHRDIKPANILVSRSGEIKLVDFGIAQSEEEEESLTKEGMALGTPSYMAPEQYDDSRTVSYKADIYSLGIMLYEMVTGKKPYPGKMTPDTLMRIQKGKYTAPRKINPTLPSSLDWYIKKCIQSKPQKRIESVSHLLRKLEKWFQTADIERIRKDLVSIVDNQERTPLKPTRKRSPLKWILSGILLAVLASGGLFLYWNGFHYRTVYARQYGGFRLTQKIENPARPMESYYLETSVFRDENGRISDEKLETVRYRPGRNSEDGTITVRSPEIYLNPGAYWLKTTVNEKVFWQNIYLPPFTSSLFLLKPASISNIVLDWPPAEPKELKVLVDAESRSDGTDLNDSVSVSVEINNKYVPIDKLKQNLMTAKAYNFKVEAEGFYPLTYDLGIKAGQDQLILRPSMIPLEGYVRLKSSEAPPETLAILINGKKTIVPGGLSSEMIDTDILGNLKSMPLTPGNYAFEFRIGKIKKKYELQIQSGVESVLLMELISEKNKITEIKISEE